MLYQWEGIPLTHYWQVAGAEQRQRRLSHRRYVLSDEDGVVVGAGAIWTCDKDHLWAHCSLPRL
jgi:hypothetical protein